MGKNPKNKGKPNPRRIPATQQDVERAERRGHKFGVSTAMAIFFTVLFVKHGATKDELQVFWREVCELSDSVAKGYVNAADLRRTLAEEYGITLE